MYGETTPTFQALLTKAGFENLQALQAAAKDATGAKQRALLQLHNAFRDLDFAEGYLAQALSAMTERVANEQKHLAEALRFEPMWIAQSASNIAEYSAKMTAAVERIAELTWISQDELES